MKTKSTINKKQIARNHNHDVGLPVITSENEDYNLVQQVSSLSERSHVGISVGYRESDIAISF